MRTSGCFDRDARQSKWAVFHGCGYVLFALQPVHLANEHKHRKRNKQEIEKSVEENTVVDRGCPRSFRLGESGIGMSRQVDEPIREVRVAGEYGGIRMSETKELTTLPNAAPMIMPTAISSMLPCSAKSLNSPTTPPPFLHKSAFGLPR